MPNFPVWNPSARISRAAVPGVAPSRAGQTVPGGASGEEDRDRIPPATQAKVWRKRFGFRSTGTCVCCHKTAIYRDDFCCGRRLAYASGGSTDVSNLEPICSSCYGKMGTHDLVSWCKKVQQGLTVKKTMPKTPAKKTVKKTTAKKPAAAKKVVKKKPAAAKKAVRKTTAKKSAAKKAKK